MIKKMSLLVTCVAALGIAHAVSASENFPKRPIKIVVPFGLGGGGDFIAIAWSNELYETLKQPDATA